MTVEIQKTGKEGKRNMPYYFGNNIICDCIASAIY
jgi:hypothetical protein